MTEQDFLGGGTPIKSTADEKHMKTIEEHNEIRCALTYYREGDSKLYWYQGEAMVHRVHQLIKQGKEALETENRDAALRLGEDTGTDPEFCELPGQVSAILTMLRLQKQITAERDSSLDFAAEKITKHYNRTVQLKAALALAQAGASHDQGL